MIVKQLYLLLIHPMLAPWHMPFVINPHFIGRLTMLNQLRCCFNDPSSHPYVAIHGLGGCGMSAVTIEFAHQIRQHHDCAVFWVSASDALRFEQSYRAIAVVLQIPEAENPEKDILSLVQQELNQYHRGKWLMVVDNIDQKDVLWSEDPERLGKRLWDFLPQNQKGMILFTTRSRQIAVGLAPNDHYQLLELESGEAEELLHKSLEYQPALYSNNEVKELLEALTYLPLAIIQALAYMKINNTSLKRYLELFWETDHSMIELLKKDFQDATRSNESQNAVVATWLISFRQIQQDHHCAAEYLSFLACITPQNVPRSIFPPLTSNIAQEEAIGTLTGYAFLKERTEVDCYDVHPLIHRVTQNWLKETGKWIRTAQAVVKRLRQLIPFGGHEQIKQYPPYLLHGLSTAGIAGIIDDKATIGLLRRIGHCRLDLGEYSHAISIFHEVLHRKMRTLGLKQEATLSAMNDLGTAMKMQGHYVEAEKVYQQVLVLTIEVLGQGHFATLISQRNLASAYRDQGRWEEAVALDIQVVETKKRVLGQEHPQTLISQGNLASTYRNSGRWEDAEALETQVGETSKRVFGLEHPHTLNSQGNLASTYWKQGRWTEAEELDVQVMKARKRVLGQEHPSTLISQANLASTLKSQDRLSEALGLMRECVEASVHRLEKEHPDTRAREAALKEWLEESQERAV